MSYSAISVQYVNMTRVTLKSLSWEFNPLDPLHLFLAAYALSCRMGTAARVVVATGSSTVGDYSMIVFTSWDYGCLGDRATKLKQKNIHYQLQVRGELSHLAGWRNVMFSLHNHSPSAFTRPLISLLFSQVDLEEESIKKRAAALTLSQKIVLYSLRVSMCFVSFGLIIAAFYGIFAATEFSQVNKVKHKNNSVHCLQSESLWWPFWSPSHCQTGKEWSGRDPGFVFWVSAFHRHHRRKLCGAAAVWPDRPDRAILPQHHRHCGTVTVRTGFSVRERTCQSIWILL